MAASLINLLGFTTGAILYAMLLWMVARSRPADRTTPDGLSLLTGVLGLFWNVGAFFGYGLYTLGLVGPSPFLQSLAFSALGFLPAVVVHSVLRSRGKLKRGLDRIILCAAYMLSSAGALLHLRGFAPSHTGLLVLTAGFAVVLVALLLNTRRTPGSGRALWVVALSVFAVSALHLSNHTGADPWWLELLGHHASIPLALAFLHQDYRFALADIFLKRAVALLILVGLVFGVYVLGLGPLLDEWAGTGVKDERTILLMLAAWVATALVYPWIRSIASWFVDHIVLKRPDYDMLLAQAVESASRHETPEAIFDDLKQLIGPALSARSVQWHTIENLDTQSSRYLPSAARRNASALIPTVESPYYMLTIAELEGGRRLLSDDVAAIEKLALLVARRLDAIRTAQERFEHDNREQEMGRLAAEAELRALQAQIHPHFLFNALTTIGHLIQEAPDRALATLMQLSGLLRGVLRSGRDYSTLGEELNVVRAYLDIERARFEDRLSVTIEVPERFLQYRLPPFLIQPLVENAIKHGISRSILGGEVLIHADLVENNSRLPSLRVTVQDTGAGGDDVQFAAGRRTGVGLNNVEKRLKCYDKDAARIEITSRIGQGTRIEILLPAETVLQAEEREHSVSAGNIR